MDGGQFIRPTSKVETDYQCKKRGKSSEHIALNYFTSPIACHKSGRFPKPDFARGIQFEQNKKFCWNLKRSKKNWNT